MFGRRFFRVSRRALDGLGVALVTAGLGACQWPSLGVVAVACGLLLLVRAN